MTATAMVLLTVLSQHAPTETHETSGHQTSWVELGVAGFGLWSFEPDAAPERIEGGGVSLAWEFTPAWAVELVVHVGVVGDEALTIPVDLMARRTWHPRDDLHPYLSFGVTAVPVLGEHPRWLAGLASAAGLDLWLASQAGVFVELNANALWSHGPVFEVGVLMGPVIRFGAH